MTGDKPRKIYHALPPGEQRIFPFRVDAATLDAANANADYFGITTASLIRQLTRAVLSLPDKERERLASDLTDNALGTGEAKCTLKVVKKSPANSGES